MKRVRFRDPAGAVRAGALENDSVTFGGSEYTLDDVDVLPPTEPEKIVCVGLNYADHVEERDWTRPERPRLFLKTPNVLAGHGDTITVPPNKQRIEYEGELGIVIGEQCRNVDVDEALSVVDGYTCLDDVSNRDDQLPEQNNVRAKAFDGAMPIGPVVVPPEDVPADATLQTRVNGEVRQETTVDRMLYSVPEILESITAFMTLEPGDIVSTGTPAGVDDVSDGDCVTVEIDGIGALSHWVNRPA